MFMHVGDKKCCIRCFKHSFLKEKIRRRARERGVCDYCGAQGRVLHVGHLLRYFENAVSVAVCKLASVTAPRPATTLVSSKIAQDKFC